MTDSHQKPEDDPHISIWTIIASTALAAFGVQTRGNQERDFAGGNPLVFIAAGIIFTVLFVLTVMGVVMLVLG